MGAVPCADGMRAAAKFCDECGASAQPSRPAERKQVTVLFGDAMGSMSARRSRRRRRHHSIDAPYVRAIFTEQIAATEGIECTRFGLWTFDPSTAATTAPDLSESRSAIDGFNRTMVDEIALHWNSLHSPGCATDLSNAIDAVVAQRQLDGLYQQALSSAI